MAIKTIEIRKQIDDSQKAMDKLQSRINTFAEREAALKERIERAVADEERDEISADVEAFNTEKTEALTEADNLKRMIESLEAELKALEEGEPSKAENPIERKIDKMENIITRDSKEYISAYARYVKTGKDAEVRSLLTENASSGTIAVPSFVDGIVRTAWDNEEIVKRIHKTYLKGNVKVGFEISSTGAVVHTEGAAAIDEETLVLGIVSMIPSYIKKYVRVSDEVLALNDEAFLDYIYRELTYQIAKKLADLIVAYIIGCPTTSSATKVAVPKLVARTISASTIAEAIGMLSDEATNPVVIMNKATWAEFKKVQYANGYGVDVFEGCDVVFNNSLPTFASATTTNPYMLVGDLAKVQANLPEGDEIKFKYDDLTEAAADMVKVHGKMMVGYALTAPNAFVKVAKA